MTSRRAAACLLLILSLLLPAAVCAQGEGPRVYLPAPEGTNALSLTWMDLKSDMNFSGSIQVPGADVSSSVYALNYNRYFSIGGRLAELWLTGIAGNVDASIPASPIGPLSGEVSGFADPYVAMRVGLYGAPALEPAKFAKTPPGFQVYGLVGLSLPWGDYEQSRPVNLGTNRVALRLGLPLVWPLGKPGSTWLEVHPNVYIFGDNDAPFMAQLRSQHALYVLESHLTHNFTPKFWAGLDLRYQNGGETTTDGVRDDNRIDKLGGGFSAGYNFSAAVLGFVGYGEVFSGDGNTRENMWRARLILLF